MSDKEQGALDLISKALSEYDKPFISSSFGKDSLAVMHLVHQVDDSVPLVFANTSVNHPSIYRLKEYYEKQGKKIISTKNVREYTFWEIVEDYGWPIGSRSSSSDKAVSHCCKKLKKKPMAEVTRGFDLEFNGMTAFESWTRYTRIKGDGKYKFVKSRGENGRQVCMPIAWWHADDVWDYIERYDINYPSVYDEEIEGTTKRGTREKCKGVEMDRNCLRVGCWACPLSMEYSDRAMKQLRKYHTKMWEFLMDEKGLAEEIAKRKLGGQGDLFDGYFQENKDYWLDKRPCFFDKL